MKKSFIATGFLLVALAVVSTACGKQDAKTTASNLVAEPNIDKAVDQIKKISEEQSTEQLEEIQREFERQTEGQR